MPQGSLGSEGREDVGRGRGRHRLSARQSGDGKGARVPSACAEADGETEVGGVTRDAFGRSST